MQKNECSTESYIMSKYLILRGNCYDMLSIQVVLNENNRLEPWQN